jgi:hypothetical protein
MSKNRKELILFDNASVSSSGWYCWLLAVGCWLFHSNRYGSFCQVGSRLSWENTQPFETIILLSASSRRYFILRVLICLYYFTMRYAQAPQDVLERSGSAAPG